VVVGPEDGVVSVPLVVFLDENAALPEHKRVKATCRSADTCS